MGGKGGKAEEIGKGKKGEGNMKRGDKEKRKRRNGNMKKGKGARRKRV